VLGLPDFENEAVREPLIGKLDLLAIDEFLTEEAIFVTDGVAMDGKPKEAAESRKQAASGLSRHCRARHPAPCLRAH
jgi:hypothetical protein